MDAIFEVLSYCASLFPSEMSDEEGEEAMFDNPPDDAEVSFSPLAFCALTDHRDSYPKLAG